MNTGLPRRRLLIAGASTLLAVGVLLLACAAPTPGGPESSSADAGITSARSALPTDRQSSGYHDFQVSTQARVYPNSPAPVYPAALEKSRTPGTVITEFVVDTNGRVDTSTVKVDSSTNEAFTASVREVLPKLRFYPAEVGGRHVKELIKLPWAFAVGQ